LKKVELIVNPVTDMGGAVGSKGIGESDVLAEAKKDGTGPRAQQHCVEAL